MLKFYHLSFFYLPIRILSTGRAQSKPSSVVSRGF